MVGCGLDKCHECPIRRDGVKPVPGDGSLTASVMFVGRDPGETENRLGKPFVGASGRFLREEINCYFNPGDYYITNLVKCHTVNNIGPSLEQMETCFTHLQEEIFKIMPRVIIALGKDVSNSIISNTYSIYNVDISKKEMSEIVGQRFEIDIFGREFVVIPVYHPSPRNYDKYDIIRRVIRDVSKDYGTKTGNDEDENNRGERVNRK